jgi:hypothetical protein
MTTYLELNDNRVDRNLGGAVKAVPREVFVALRAHSRKKLYHYLIQKVRKGT